MSDPAPDGAIVQNVPATEVSAPTKEGRSMREIEAEVFGPGENGVSASLTVRQLQAVEMLVNGYGDREVAETLQVHRVSVTRWRLYHLSFRAAMNRRRQEMWGSAGDRFRSLLARAVDVMEERLFSEDPREQIVAARAMLGLASRGHFSPGEEPEDHRGVLEQMARQNRQERLSKNEAEAMLLPSDYEDALANLGRRAIAFKGHEERPELDALPEIPALHARRLGSETTGKARDGECRQIATGGPPHSDDSSGQIG